MSNTSTAVANVSANANQTSHAGSTSPPVCKNCHTSTTPLWRRDEHGAVLCNACGLFLKLHGRPRPISLKTDVIKSRNRKSNSHNHADSPNDKKKKDGSHQKKRKLQDARELHAAETLETLMKNGGSRTNGTPSSHAYQKILPNSTVPQSNYKVSLPHLSMLLGSVPPSENTDKTGQQLSKHNQQSTPQPMGGYQPSPQASQQAPPPQPSKQHSSATATSVASPILNPEEHSMERQASHLASINEILNNQKTKSEKSISAIASPAMHPQTMPMVPNSHSPMITPIPSHSNGSLAQAMMTEANNSENNYHVRTGSHYSNSPPPMDLQKQAVESSTTSRSSNGAYNGDSGRVGSASMMKQQEMELQSPLHFQQKKLQQEQQQRQYEEQEQLQLQLQLQQQQQQRQQLQTQTPLAMVLQSQEEVIKLKTRISELELVTDLYKRHIFELDAKCRILEGKLNRD